MDKDYVDEGVINLAIAIINEARAEYEAHLNVCSDLQARLCAERDSRGIVGYILEYATGDKQFMLKQVENEIKRRYKRG